MVFWFIQFNYVNVIITLVISLLFVVLALVLFKYMWLDLPELKVPTTYFSDEYKFGPEVGFLARMNILVFDILNQDYWINHIGFDGSLTRLLLPVVSPQDHPLPAAVPVHLQPGLPVLLPARNDHEHGLHRERFLPRNRH